MCIRDRDKIEEMYDLAQDIKKKFYGNRIVMFAPLYLSNYCINGCTYCPYHGKNKHIARKKLTQAEVANEAVSYTPLDVYKRQASLCEAQNCPWNAGSGRMRRFPLSS